MKKRTLIVSILSVLGILIIGYLIICIFSYRQIVQKYELKHPDAQEIWKNLKLGREYSSQKKFKEAEDSYKKAIELNPDYAPSYHGLGLCYYGQERYDEAAKMFRKALELNPQFKDAQIFLKIAESFKLEKEEGTLLSSEQAKKEIEELEAKIKELEKETAK